MPKPKTRHIAKRARLCHASSPASEEDYVYESSGICLTPVPPSPQRLSAVVPVDQLPEKEGFRRRSPSSRDGQYGPGRDVFSSLLDWLESVT